MDGGILDPIEVRGQGQREGSGEVGRGRAGEGYTSCVCVPVHVCVCVCIPTCACQCVFLFQAERSQSGVTSPALWQGGVCFTRVCVWVHVYMHAYVGYFFASHSLVTSSWP